MNAIIDHLLTRRSIKAQEHTSPGPSEEELALILEAANRVPDHKKLGPWRFLLIKGQARQDTGKVLAEIFKADHPDASDKLIEFESNRFIRSPLVIGVIISPVENEKVPRDEQVLAVGAVCQNLIVAASSLGYGAQWLTEWYSYHRDMHSYLKLAKNESLAGFVYIGSTSCKPEERQRANLEDRIKTL